MRRTLGQGGQMITEAVLILVILMMVTFSVAAYFKNNEVVKTLVSGPWQNLAGMLQNGVWGPPNKTSIVHPNSDGRHITKDGEKNI